MTEREKRTYKPRESASRRLLIGDRERETERRREGERERERERD